ncbi:hypothetical protein J6590_073849 [Homalodisca vitripennis]|nr:hypothetical protein J6590_073849 [Homalodisca vitripennis]
MAVLIIMISDLLVASCFHFRPIRADKRDQHRKHVIRASAAYQFNNILESIQNRCIKVSETDKKKKISKLEKIRPKKCDLPKDGNVNTDANNKNVINLSSKILNEAEISVLSKGLNFSVAQKSIKALDFLLTMCDMFDRLHLLTTGQGACYRIGEYRSKRRPGDNIGRGWSSGLTSIGPGLKLIYEI